MSGEQFKIPPELLSSVLEAGEQNKVSPETIKMFLEMGIDITPVLGDIKALGYDVPKGLFTGDYLGAGLAAASSIPFLGSGVDALRAANKIKAYHGTEATFDAFKEAAGDVPIRQQYGVGTYTSTSPELANTYRPYAESPSGAVDWAGERAGNLYELRIATKKDKLLDWDKPLGEQPENVQKKLAKAGFSDPTLTGKQIYYKITPNATTPKEASDALNKLGIDGISYIDKSTAAYKDKNITNYVVFDPRIIEIVKEKGISPLEAVKLIRLYDDLEQEQGAN